MNIAWRCPFAPTTCVEGHRELDDGVEPGVGAVTREHLLDRDPRVAGAEEMDEAAARDRVGAELRDLGHGGALALESPSSALAARGTA